MPASKILKNRSKRSSLLSYLFSNGEELDSLNNVVVDLAGVMNENIQSISKNEEFLFQKEKELINRSLTTAKRLEVLKVNFNSLNFEMKNRFYIEQNSVNNIYKFNQKSLNLERINLNLFNNLASSLT